MFTDFAKTWKWVLPGFICILLTWGGVMVFVKGWKDAGSLMIILALFAFAIAGTKYWEINSNIAVENYRKRKEADAITPRGMMLEAGKGVHPETIRLILGEQARRWGLVSGSKSGTGKPYAVLFARPRVTEEFLVYFLRGSSERHYMSKHGRLSDGDKSWDPQGIVSAYEMYDDLESLLVEEMKVTRPFGNTKPGYWLGEWDARSVGLDFGVDIDEWSDGEVVETVTASSTVRGEVPSVIAKALEGLEQTPEMKQKSRQLFKS